MKAADSMAMSDIMALIRTSDSFVVRDYSLVKPDEPEPVITIVPVAALFKVIEDAHRNSKHITISPVGQPIIDWR